MFPDKHPYNKAPQEAKEAVQQLAQERVAGLRKEVDALIIIPNDRLLDLSDRSMTVIDAFKTADGALLAGVQGITDLMTMNSYIHVDFRDVTQILKDQGTALFGIGSARGEDRATQAAELAISSPLLEASIEGAHGALVNVAGPTDLGMQEAQAAVELVQHSIHPEAQIIWGLALDDAYGDEVRVTVIAAGFDSVKQNRAVSTSPLIKNSNQGVAANRSTVSSEESEQRPEVPAINPVRLSAAQGSQGTDQNMQSRSADNADKVDDTAEHPTAKAAGQSNHDSRRRYDDSSDDDFDDLDIPPFLR